LSSLLYGLGKLTRAFLDLCSSRVYGFSQLGGHAIEMVSASIRDLIPGSYFNAVIEAARFQLLRPELQRPDGNHYMAREQDARDDSQSDTNREKQRSAVKNSVDRAAR
jgi:hypothetical protein